MSETKDEAVDLHHLSDTEKFSAMVACFREHVPRKVHRKMLATYDDSFTGSDAVLSLMKTLPALRTKLYGSDVPPLTEENCVKFLQMLVRHRQIREAGPFCAHSHLKEAIFQNNSCLYVLMSPEERLQVEDAQAAENRKIALRRAAEQDALYGRGVSYGRDPDQWRDAKCLQKLNSVEDGGDGRSRAKTRQVSRRRSRSLPVPQSEDENTTPPTGGISVLGEALKRGLSRLRTQQPQANVENSEHVSATSEEAGKENQQPLTIGDGVRSLMSHIRRTGSRSRKERFESPERNLTRKSSDVRHRPPTPKSRYRRCSSAQPRPDVSTAKKSTSPKQISKRGEDEEPLPILVDIELWQIWHTVFIERLLTAFTRCAGSLSTHVSSRDLAQLQGRNVERNVRYPFEVVDVILELPSNARALLDRLELGNFLGDDRTSASNDDGERLRSLTRLLRQEWFRRRSPILAPVARILRRLLLTVPLPPAPEVVVPLKSRQVHENTTTKIPQLRTFQPPTRVASQKYPLRVPQQLPADGESSTGNPSPDTPGSSTTSAVLLLGRQRMTPAMKAFFHPAVDETIDMTPPPSSKPPPPPSANEHIRNSTTSTALLDVAALLLLALEPEPRKRLYLICRLLARLQQHSTPNRFDVTRDNRYVLIREMAELLLVDERSTTATREISSADAVAFAALLLDHHEYIFCPPNCEMQAEVQKRARARQEERRSGKRREHEEFDEISPSGSAMFCERVATDDYSKLTLSTTEQQLQVLFDQILTISDSGTRAKMLRNFAANYGGLHQRLMSRLSPRKRARLEEEMLSAEKERVLQPNENFDGDGLTSRIFGALGLR